MLCEIHGHRASGRHKTLRLRRRVLWWPEARRRVLWRPEARWPCISPSGFVATGGPMAMYFTHHGKPWLKPTSMVHLQHNIAKYNDNGQTVASFCARHNCHNRKMYLNYISSVYKHICKPILSTETFSLYLQWYIFCMNRSILIIINSYLNVLCRVNVFFIRMS